MNERILGKVLKSGANSGRTGTPEGLTGGLEAEEFAKKVINHFGRPFPVSQLEVPILQTSETEQVSSRHRPTYESVYMLIICVAVWTPLGPILTDSNIGM